MGQEHFEGANHIHEGNASVTLPLLKLLGALDKDNKVLVFALVVHLGCGSFSSGHDESCCWYGGGVGRERQASKLCCIERSR